MRGEIFQVSDAETREIALRTCDKESNFAAKLTLISVVGMIALIIIGVYLGRRFDNDAITAVLIFFFLICLFMLGFSLVMIECLRTQYKFQDERSGAKPNGRNSQAREQPRPGYEFTVTKIKPTSSLNLKRRIVGFLFGASIPISFVILEHIAWNYVLMISVGFGVVGFILGDKYYDKITRFIESNRRNS